jgi:hypothetical protein
MLSANGGKSITQVRSSYLEWVNFPSLVVMS